jgi:beta-aspartyl-peptidase (threonine type)
MPDTWSIIVHGGAKTIRADRQDANRRGCLAAARAGQAVLEAGGSAVDAVVAAIKVLEDDATFNAGYGSVLNADGEVELDAALMDGATLDVGAVAALAGARNPIAVCQSLLHDKPVLLVGDGALRYARETGATICDPAELKAEEIVADEACDTVGCVAFDSQGNLAAGTSTGGLGGVRPGRVGDSPIPGGGLYAENGVGGVSFSGEGESILRLALAARLMHALASTDASHAASLAIAQMPRVGGEAGCIVLGPTGEPAFAHNSGNFAVALATHERPAAAYLSQEEFSA